jgi:flagella basal body P-ring formation protein FlgA
MLMTLHSPQYPANRPARPGRRQTSAALRWLGMLWGLAMLLNVTAPAAADPAPDLETHIHQAIIGYLEASLGAQHDNLRYDPGNLDPRLRLESCGVPLGVSFPVGARQLGYTTLAVDCLQARPWKIHVPVTISRFAEVLVTTRHLPRGSQLSAGDVRLERQDLARLTSGYFTAVGDLEQLVLTRNLRQAMVITPAAVETPRLVRRGDDVTIQAGSGQLAIHVKGRALMDGRMGERIRVQNTRSQRELQATVVGPGQVRAGS